MRRQFTLSWALLACCVGMTLHARESWSVTRSGSIHVITDASTVTALRVLDEITRTQAMLARFTAVDGPLPVRVLALHDARALAEVAPPQSRRGDLHTLGFSLTGPHDAFIVLRTDRPDAMLRATLRHEYVHVLTAARSPEAPAWLDEGLSEFWSASEVEGDHLVVGRPIPEYVSRLQRHKWLPLDAVLQQPRGSLPANPENVPSFYAQSWAMVHYLLLGAHDDATPAFVPKALTLPTQFESSVRDYVLGNQLRETTIAWTPRVPPSPQVAMITEARALAERANLLVSGQDSQTGLSMARRALKLDANEPLALQVVGTYYFRNNQPDQAREWLTRALNIDANSFSAALYLSLLAPAPAERLRYAELAIRARPDSSLAWQRLGVLWCGMFSRNWLWFGAVPCA